MLLDVANESCDGIHTFTYYYSLSKLISSQQKQGEHM